MQGSLAIIAARRGDLTAASRHLAEGEERLGQQPYLRGLLLCCRGEVAILAGQTAQAHDALGEAEALASALDLTDASELSIALAALRSQLSDGPSQAQTSGSHPG